MDAGRWRRISRLYHQALERPFELRDAFLDSCCEGDEELRREVASLLAHNPGAEPLLLEPGATLGSYRIQRPLGRGGMGAVFLAHDETLHRQVALKVLTAREGDATDATARARLLREARNAAALNHPNICTVYEVGEEDGRRFIAMEYVEGQPLSDVLARSVDRKVRTTAAAGLPLETAIRYGIEAADALAHAHDHGVIHRDLKAANAIVTTAGRLKLVDFGLARRDDAFLVDATTMTSVVPAGVAVGTPYAMAPEQVRGVATDARTDIWALGVLLYELASGARPFHGATVPELFSSILRDPPAALPAGVPNASQLEPHHPEPHPPLAASR